MFETLAHEKINIDMISTSTIRTSCIVAEEDVERAVQSLHTAFDTGLMPPGRREARILWLLRHAKTVADPPPGGSDYDRVLAPRAGATPLRSGGSSPATRKDSGRRSSGVPRPTVVLVSPAARNDRDGRVRRSRT